MNEPDGAGGPRRNKTLTVATYLLHLLGAATVVTAIIAVTINYARREAVQGTVYASHFDWQIRSFWWAFGAGALASVLIVLAETVGPRPVGAAGALIALVALFWFVYRILKGFMWLNQDEPVGGRAGASGPAGDGSASASQGQH